MKVKRIIDYLFCASCFVLFGFFGLNCAQKFNNIVNIFHHVGTNNIENNSLSYDDESNQNSKTTKIAQNNQVPQVLDYSLELGNLVFYFENKPVINFVPERAKSEHLKSEKISGISSFGSKVFIFPYAQIKDDKLLKKTNMQVGLGYKLKIERVSSPIKGVKITFLYDMNLVDLDYKFFDSIGNYKGIVFNFYNKNLIDKLKNLDDKVLKTVQLKNECKKKIVIVDLGHGGSDFGAIAKSGLSEKDVTLSLGCKVKNILKKKGYDVFLTRDCDKTVALDERTSFANNFSQDKLLVSIHANSSLNTDACGLETFCLDDRLFEDNGCFFDKDIDNKCVENNRKLIGNVLSSRNRESLLLASNLHENVYNFIRNSDSNYKNRGVKKSVSQLLLGSHMPAALIEVGFLSNEKDLNFLQSLDNQELVANGICNGIIEYFDHKNDVLQVK